MSFYDDASLIFDAGAAAGKDGTAFNLKPVEELTGPNKVINGGFDSDSDWSKGTGWSISGGLASCDGTQTGNTGLSQLLSSDRLEEGETYKVTYTISNYVAGNVNPHIRGTSTGNVNGNGTRVVYGIAGNSASYDINFFADSNFNASIDNVSIRKVVNKAADFTFARGSNLSATRIGPDGLIEKGRENLLLQSNTFSETWTDPNADIDGGYAGYDGTNDAWELSLTGTYGQTAQAVSASGVNTFSFYAKRGTSDFTRPYIAGPNKYAYFDLLNGQTGLQTGVASSIEDAGNGWWRCSFTVEGTIAEVRIHVADGINTIGTATSGTIYIQDAQLEVGLAATDYIETGATTATAGLLEDEPRFDYSGGGCPALLMEPTRANLMGHSEYFGAWTSLKTTVNDNQAVSPEGVSNAAEIVPTAASGEHYIEYGGFSRTAGEYLTQSVYAKANGYNYLYLNNAASRLYAVFDIANGSVEHLGSNGTDFTNESADIQSVGNGWFRCTLTGDAVTTAASYVRIGCAPTSTDSHNINFTGDGTSGAFVYGMQVEKGSYATSYIPTYGAAATRSKEKCNVNGVSGEIGQTQGTIFLDADLYKKNNTEFYIAISDGTLSNSIYLYQSSQIIAVNKRISGATESLQVTSANWSSGRNKCAITYTATKMKIFVNGVLKDTKTISGLPSGLSKLTLGSRQDDLGELASDANYKQALVFPTVLSNNDCEILTGTSYTSFASMASTLSYTQYE